MAGRLKGKIAVITGAGSGTGRAAAELYAAEGARVVLADIDEESGVATTETVRSDGYEARFVRTDITDGDSVAELFDTVETEFGGLHVLFNCAGGSSLTDTVVTRLTVPDIESAYRFNLIGTLLCCQSGLQLIRRTGGGSVVNVGTATAIRGGIWPSDAYTAAKGAVVAVTRSMAANFAQYGIRVNVVCPGMVRSPRVVNHNLGSAGVLDTGDVVPMLVDFERYPFAAGDPIDLAYIALFLSSDESRMITGAVIAADGGMSAY